MGYWRFDCSTIELAPLGGIGQQIDEGIAEHVVGHAGAVLVAEFEVQFAGVVDPFKHVASLAAVSHHGLVRVSGTVTVYGYAFVSQRRPRFLGMRGQRDDRDLWLGTASTIISRAVRSPVNHGSAFFLAFATSASFPSSVTSTI